MGNKSRFDSRLLLDNREICIFLSSTFSDMQEERSALVRTFDKLKVAAMQRNVTLSLLDLRWGVTDEEARTGKVVSVCLNEIERSHPFFVGILGSHYGTAFDPEELRKNPDLLERYPWIEQDSGRSITEIEMLYGVLRNTDNPVDAAFYIKQTEEPDDNPRQTALKETIRAQKRFPVADYSSIDELCAFVEKEVYGMLDRHFPDGEHTPLERERTAQRAFVNSRHNNFVGREDDLRFLDRFACSERRRLVVTGDSGMGKSALLANWIRNNETNATFNLAYHFVGNSLSGNSYESVLRHLCDEIYDLYGIEKDPNRKEKPEEEAQRLVDEVGHREKPLVAVIDGINQILSPTNEKLLLWLPSTNGKVQFIFTTLADDITMHALECRGYERYMLGPLSDAQRKEFTIGYLDRVGKHLEPRQLCRIVDDPENRNTLVLRTLLDELICFGSYEHLDERIDRYLDAEGLPDFFDRVLQRMEEDYDNGQQLVSQTLTLIALSEHGLSVEEIIAITGFRPMDWHLFYCAFFDHLVVKEGLVTFSHQYVADAVAQRYSTDDTVKVRPYRLKIVNNFVKAGKDDKTRRQRRISELAHQYYHLSDWDKLYKTLLTFEAFDYFDRTNETLLAKYWRALIASDKDRYKLTDYLQLPYNDDDASSATAYNKIGLFISDYFGDYDKALEYYFKDLAISEKVLGAGHPDTATSYNNIGLVYDNLGDYDKALDYYFKALAISEKVLGTDHPSTATSYNNIGLVYYHQGDYDKALEYYFKALAISEKVLGTEHPSTATSYNNIGSVYYHQGDYDKALDYYFKDLAISEKVFGSDHPSTATSYNNIGLVYKNQGSYDKALDYYFKALAISEKVLGPDHPSTATSYNNIGSVYDNQGNYDKALDYYFKALAISEKVLGTGHPSTATSYNNIGLVYDNQGNYDKALDYYFKDLAISEKVFGSDHPDTATSYNNIGLVYYHQGDYDKALEYHFKALAIREKVLGTDHPSTATSYNNIGLVYYHQGDYDKALECYFKALAIWEKVLGTDHPSTATSYNNIGSVYYHQGDYDKALEYHFKALAICEKVLGKEHPDTATSYNNIGLVYYHQGDYDKALEYYSKALAIQEKTLCSEHPSTATSYNNIGVLYYQMEQYPKALEYLEKAFFILKNVLGDDHPDTQDTQKSIDATKAAMDD